MTRNNVNALWHLHLEEDMVSMHVLTLTLGTEIEVLALSTLIPHANDGCLITAVTCPSGVHDLIVLSGLRVAILMLSLCTTVLAPV